jgi:lipoprotein-releasing system permease protein
MKKPLLVFIGLRYLRARSANQYVSFVAFASVLGVMLGVAALIVVLSVMNGFENELRDRLLSMSSHASISSREGIANNAELAAELTAQPGVEAVAPFIELEAMLSTGRELGGAILTGIDPAAERVLTSVSEHIISGSYDSLQSGSANVLLGIGLARQLDVLTGDKITLLVPQRRAPAEAGGNGSFSSVIRSFTVTGIFEMGLQDHDSVRALIHLDDAADLAGMSGRVGGLRIRVSDIFAAPSIMQSWQTDSVLAENLKVSDWTIENASYFRAVRIEKIMMALLLSLIIGVAAFNIVASLVMVVTEKRGGIAILRTLGCSRRTIIGIFVFQGTVIGWLGCLCGIALGVYLSLNVATLAPALESLFGFQFMPGDVYYLTSLPADLHWTDVLGTSITVLVITMLATLYPASRAASVEPSEVLRYE